MKVSSKAFGRNLFRIWGKLNGKDNTRNYLVFEPPLRAELFSADQMKQHGKLLAASHHLKSGRSRNSILQRLADNESILLDVYNLLTEDVKADRRITPASEWLLDNFYLIEEQIRTAKRHFPKGYSSELPHLLDGPNAGYPRVYDIALEIISHGDGRVDPEILSSFVTAYQSESTLKLGELWAIPIMLRLALMENLRRVAARIAADRWDRKQAEYWADQMTEVAAKDPKNLILTIADMARSNPPMVSPFVAELAHRLQGQVPVLSLPLTWIEQHLSDVDLTIEQLVRTENQQQAADQISISNSIGSLRFLGAMNWQEFVESMSSVEQILKDDPADVYDKMDFATRDSYRHVVEEIAKHCDLSESEVAALSIRLAGEGARSNDGDDRTAHVGYYLIDDGVLELKRLVKPHVSVGGGIRLSNRKTPFGVYAGTILLMTVIWAWLFVARAANDGLQGWALGLFGLLLMLCVAHLVIALANWLTTILTTPHLLPRMDFSQGIPSGLRTLVVVPTMLSSTQGVLDLVKGLEVRFLANQDDNIHFALLTDFRDAENETLPADEELLTFAGEKIAELNRQYSSHSHDTFFLFHRPRKWNPQERIWMGYERKRGKLADLNKLLLYGTGEAFSLIVGDTSILSGVKYVITLDTDTQLPRDSARQFVSAMAHPLNRAFFDDSGQHVVKGYGILQPRVAISMPEATWSRYSQMSSNEPGIDPYTRSVSDVYQDLFGEGSFIGKGIYEVDAFERALGDRFPRNRILSHDLLEGCYVRSGLLSDVQLYEEYPTRYFADVSRRHRWIRGDWQIAQWALPLIPGSDGHLQKNPLSLLSRWKILDNLRRSLTSAGLTLLLLLGWMVLSSAWFWTLLAVLIILIPSLIGSLYSMLHKSDDVSLREHVAAELRSLKQRLMQDAFTVTCLPYEGYYSLDAMLRTWWRLHISHRHLLEWNPSSGTELEVSSYLIDTYRKMWIAPLLAVASAVVLAILHPAVLLLAVPILGLWFASPAIVWWISLPLSRRQAKLTPHQISYLRKLSRKTWSFFETFISLEDNWLPPDNYQEQPVAKLAHRTSPTNMGLALLANLSAYDFGFISAGKLLERTANALHSMNKLDKFRGHFYNWYDTQSMKPLRPYYISSVDSGNLAGHLLVLKQGLLHLIDEKIISARSLESLADTVSIMIDFLQKAPEPNLLVQTIQLQKDVESLVLLQPASMKDIRQQLIKFEKSSQEIYVKVDAYDPDPESQLKWWVQAFSKQCKDVLDDVSYLAPFVEVQSSPADLTNIPELAYIPSLNDLLTYEEGLLHQLNSSTISAENEFLNSVKTAALHASERLALTNELILLCDTLAQMRYDFLYDEARHLLAIGYNVSESLIDASFYDLLASEARFSSFVAIAQGSLPQKIWFAMGRLLTTAGGEPVLLSWSGSMFEYLMPLLVMPSYEHTLLDQTYNTAVARQIEYAKRRGVPWGISESGYNLIDVQLNYQYRAFGVPGLGLKRGLAEDLVIAPYASVLALMVAPEAACQNLERLSAAGFEARYGLYEAIDYTPSRLQSGQSYAIVRSFMAHHQGMSLLSLEYLLLDRPMQKRFEADPLFLATMLLLQERIPKATTYYAHTSKLSEHFTTSDSLESPIRVFNNPNTPNPEVQLLSNGRYHVMITNAGGGYSRWQDIAVTRWREDRTRDNWGTFCYIRDLASKEFWSAAFQPVLKQVKHYEAIFSEGRAEFRGRYLDYDTHTEIAVSPEDDIELRRIRITNRARTRRTIDITSYAEVVLAPQAADELHPAFSNLFVQTEIVRRSKAILCTRRPRSQSEKDPWMFHLMAVHGAETEEIAFETDRVQFVGRGNDLTNPLALRGGRTELSGSDGSVLDPIVSIRKRMTLEPDEAVTINIVTGIGETRDAALALVEKYQDRRLADRVFELTWTHSQVLLRQFNISEADAQLYGRLASSVIHANSSLRADPGILIRNRRGQSGLWGYAISGDLPIVLLQIQDPANIELVRQLVQAHAYWRLKGLSVDLVIWNEDHAGYRQLLHDQIMEIIAAGGETNVTDQPGGIYVKPVDQIAEEDRILFQTVARAIITDYRGSLVEQIAGRRIQESTVPFLAPTRTHRHESPSAPPLPRHDLLFFNGLGGFTPDGREYVITTTQSQNTPAPWVNVLANPHFGTVVSESGLAYTWCENAHEMRLTPWGNDSLRDSPGEALYLRDEERGNFWSPTPKPCGGTPPYVTRHGFGYSVFEHTENGIKSELWVFVALDSAVKFSLLKLRNVSDRSRRLSATGYVEWVLGDLRAKTSMHVITEIDNNTGALFARNPYNIELHKMTAFFDVDDASRTVTGDRTEFLGRNGTLSSPAAMTRTRLSGKVGAALDPCAAIQVTFDLLPGQEREIVFRLGIGRDNDDARNLVNRFRGSAAARTALDNVWQYWNHTLGTVNVDTPDMSLNVLANGWLAYQTIACRIWGRSAFYQSGGAFGFRDQLQDVLALLHASPALARAQLLLCASRQFPEGDVQHWWHPPIGRGVRTHCSDDYLWLPFVVCQYVKTTGDTGVLDEQANYLQGRPVNADEDSYYDLPVHTDEKATLYEHCVLSIQHSLRFGAHGLPFIGTGDWNDGMNLVGHKGKGESVWLGFFLYNVLRDFTELALMRKDSPFVEICASAAGKLQANIESQGWDGEWYRRAYFDDGSPLGSKQNTECQIDSIAQSWSVLSGAGDPQRTLLAMQALDERLVRPGDKLIQLLDPPFNLSALDPGYIKGYVPGVRENGGQYTHAAIWATMAFAKLGNSQRAWDLFSMINPVNHARTSEETAIYKVEPYVVAADVYYAAPHTGRGGWTWYTGSAAWMYRLILESLLGLKLEVDKLSFKPCLPSDWQSFKIHYRYRETVYHITVQQSSAEGKDISLSVDGVVSPDGKIPLVADQIEHWVEVKVPFSNK